MLDYQHTYLRLTKNKQTKSYSAFNSLFNLVVNMFEIYLAHHNITGLIVFLWISGCLIFLSAK